MQYFWQFVADVVNFLGMGGVYASIAALAGAVPLLAGFALGQRTIGVCGFLSTACAFILLGPLVGALALLLITTVVVAVSQRRMKTVGKDEHIDSVKTRDE
jgi:hypothetical protein